MVKMDGKVEIRNQITIQLVPHNTNLMRLLRFINKEVVLKIKNLTKKGGYFSYPESSPIGEANRSETFYNTIQINHYCRRTNLKMKRKAYQDKPFEGLHP